MHFRFRKAGKRLAANQREFKDLISPIRVHSRSFA
jgi:hypothetical protein